MEKIRFFLTLSGQLWFIVFILSIIGLFNLYSATSYLEPKATLFIKQIIWVCLGFFILWLITKIDCRRLYIYAYPIYIFNLFLLLLVLIIASPLMGAKRWLGFGPISFQPSELAKLTLIIVLARYLAETDIEIQNLKVFLKMLILTLLPAFLIILEPDLGTALFLLIIFGTMCFLSKVNHKIIIGAIIVSFALLPVFWQFGLKDYQKARILGFLSPQKDPLGIGYHIKQTKIAIGSGQFWGKGFLKGTQNKLRFLPEHYTDFIFSVFAEEWGFIGCMFLLVFYLLLILTGIKIAENACHPFTFLLAAGIISMFFWEIVINIFMALGLLPVVGIPLPFMSYGGSSTLINFIGVGILINIDRRGKWL